MEKVTCKRCGRALTSPESIKRGYGPKCFKITQLQEKSQEVKIQNEVQKIEISEQKNTPKEHMITSEIDFLKCEINMIKRQLKQAQYGTIVHESRPIERIRREEHRPERNVNMTNFSTVINELKTIFTQGDPKKMLIHVPKEELKII